MTSFRSFLPVALFAALALTVVGCDSVDTDDEDSGRSARGEVRVEMTAEDDSDSDAAPNDEIAEARVTVSGVVLAGDDDRYRLSDQTQEFDLLALRSGTAQLALSRDVPEGEYDQLRLEISDVYLRLDDGSEPSLNVPSGTVRLLMPEFEIDDDNDQANVVVAFNTGRSFVRGTNGTYRFTPVLRLGSLEFNGSAFGDNVTLEGQVTALDSTALEIEGLPFVLNESTVFSDDGGNRRSRADLAIGQFVEVNARLDDSDDTYTVRTLEWDDDANDDTPTLEAPLDEVRVEANTLMLLGVPFLANTNTVFDGFQTLSDLQRSGRVEIDFSYTSGTNTYLLLQVEPESYEND